MQVLSVSGVESESEARLFWLAGSGPAVAAELRRLPQAAAAALAGATVVGPAGNADRFSVSSHLNLLSARPKRKPVLVVAMTVQWLDGASQEALTAVARGWTPRHRDAAAVRSAGEPVTAAGRYRRSSRARPGGRRARCSGPGHQGRTVAPHVQEQLWRWRRVIPLHARVPAALSDDEWRAPSR